MSLGLDPIHRLTPHERSIPSLSQKLASDIKSLGYVIHPVIVDAKTHVIVDGTHRAEALSILGAKFVPAYMVDYLGGDVILETWARLLHTRVSTDEVEALTRKHGLAIASLGSLDILVGGRPADYPLLILTGDEVLGVSGEGGRLFSLVEVLDERFKMSGLEYVMEGELLRRARGERPIAGYLIPFLEKRRVVEMAVQGIRLPPKSTRHVVVNRPMFIFCPLDLLTHPAVEAEDSLRAWVDKSRKFHLPPGMVIDRFYEEPITVYYFEGLRHLYPAELLSRLLLGP